MKYDILGPPGSLRLTTLEAHAAGEPLRIIVRGFPPLPGRTILAKRRFARNHYDHIRTALMGEPRGHADMYGALITPPEHKDSHIGVLFLHNEGFSTMCGHGIIALTTAVLEAGLVKVRGSRPVLRIDTPAGTVEATARVAAGRVREVSFRNVPSFAYALDLRVEVPGIGALECDLAFGGAFYAFCRAEDLGLRLVPAEFRKIIEAGMRIKRAVAKRMVIKHPFEKDLGFLYGTIIIGPAAKASHHSRNVCVFADSEVDRSPTGTGVSARAALLFARGSIAINSPFTVESILGTCFTGRVLEETRFGRYPAVIPEVTGSASITGRAEWLIDPRDPLKNGFFLR
jgi:proline racemase